MTTDADRRQILVAGAAALASLPGAAAAQGRQTDYRSLALDASRPSGSLKTRLGVNGQPKNRSRGWDVTAAYRDAGVDLVRIHDAGAGDIDSRYTARGRPPGQGALPVGAPLRTELNALQIFPDPEADPNDPASYNFGPTDQLIAEIREAGAQPLFRLGRSAQAEADIPDDFDRYAQVCANVVRHYNLGWAGGFNYGIQYWEVWNEPDFGSFWLGGVEDYLRLYEKVATAVKAADPAVSVGGPTLARPVEHQPWFEPFLAYVKAKGLPLDFYSWHWYSDINDPWDYARIGADIRRTLNKYGFHKTESILDEWNSSLANRLEDNSAIRAAFLASAWNYMQEVGVDLQMYYRADGVFAAEPRREAQVLRLWGRMKDTPQALSVQGATTDGFSAVAGRSEDGQTVQVIVSNYEVPEAFRTPSPPGPLWFLIPGEGKFEALRRQTLNYRDNRGYDLSLSGLRTGEYAVERYRIDAAEPWRLVDRQVLRGPRVRLNAPLPPPGVEFIRLTWGG